MDLKKVSSGRQWQLFILENLSWILIVVFYALFAALRPVGMLKWSTLVFIVYSSLPLGFLVFGTGVCLMSGRLDLYLHLRMTSHESQSISEENVQQMQDNPP